jgi:hypothetical protein
MALGKRPAASARNCFTRLLTAVVETARRELPTASGPGYAAATIVVDWLPGLLNVALAHCGIGAAKRHRTIISMSRGSLRGKMVLASARLCLSQLV